MFKMRRIFLILLICSLCVGCDQFTKVQATKYLSDQPTMSFLWDTFRLQYSLNTGAMLSLGANLSDGVRALIFTYGVGLFLIILAIYTIFKQHPPLTTIALSLFLGGGIGNLIDRYFQGYVVDFLNVGIGWLRTGIFNVADMAVMLGFGILIFTQFSEGDASEDEAEDEEPQEPDAPEEALTSA